MSMFVGLERFIHSLYDLAMPPDVIEDLIKVLRDESIELEDGEPVEVAPTVFGGRFSAENLAQHTQMAHQFLANSVIEAIASLQGSGDAVKQFRDELEGVDADSHAATHTLLKNTQVAVDQHDQNPDTPPVGATEGNNP